MSKEIINNHINSPADPNDITKENQDTSVKTEENKDWTNTEKIAFRIAFIFFFLLVVPLDLDF